ncbi:penicillin-binding transpeptidase domain-containing protein [Lacticaseibacillus sharpeae]|uniref:Cell division protein FtsI n=2 Tax=Lacticaseibacillus sharpeae TaxID=1626 RepID=A0A0R2A032_9LACO|nr:penicillin-binding transpeptidase domain-containing protein [Lacticaseibacillus sharpeae]KRM56604.1 cell division protein FtsI [Lacticaseibacillus sharpeae JCM 1186 = DSM 20505]
MSKRKGRMSEKQMLEHLRRNRQWFGFILLSLTVLALVLIGVKYALIIHGQADEHNLTKSRLSQVTRTKTVVAKRGEIVDVDGNAIASTGNTYTVYAIIKHQYKGDTSKIVKDKAKTAKLLANHLPVSEAEILKRLNPANGHTTQVEFGGEGSGLSLATKQAIEKENLAGIHFTTTPARLYPNGIFASHEIGRTTATTSKNGLTTLAGTMGLEKSFNKLLTGTNGEKRMQTDRFGYTVAGTAKTLKKAQNGGTVYTTINSNLQNYLESLMTSVQEKYSPTAMTATLMNAKTGAILATSQRPTYEPTTGSGLANAWRSMLVQDVYEPGSVMKIMTLAAAINSGNYHPNEYYKSGQIKVDGATLSDWNKAGWGMIPLSQAFTRSSNVGMVKIEQAMGAKTWLSYLKKFGFGSKTGMPLPSESAGSIAYSSTPDQASTAFGQAINVTVVQMLRAMSAVADGGQMVEPRIVSKTETASGKVTKYGTKKLAKVISADTAAQVREAMVKVVKDENGTGGSYAIKGMDVGVKTGTAQISGAHGYLAGSQNYLHSVAAMVPSKNPKYLVYITLKQPKIPAGTVSANDVIATIFKPLIKRAIALESNSGSEAGSAMTKIGNLDGQKLTTVRSDLQKQGFQVAVIGTGNEVVQQLPVANQEAMNGSRVILMTNGAMTMPSVSGWGKSDVLKLAQITGVKFKLKGEGYASAQSLKAGSLITGDTVTVTFTSK